MKIKYIYKRIIAKLSRERDIAPITVFLFTSKLFWKNIARPIKFLNYKIQIQDFLSFYYEVIYIFRDQIYYFESKNKKPLIIDGGTCIGTSILYFKRIYPESRIIAFEPSTEVFKILGENILKNRLEDVKLINRGLYDSETRLSFSNNEVDSGKIDPNGENAIDVIRLSKYIVETIDFLKLNIEGAEYQVLEELDESKKIKEIREMCLEWHSFSHQKQNLDKVLEILTKNNFKYYISSLSTARPGKFKAEDETEYFLMIYAKNHN